MCDAMPFGSMFHNILLFFMLLSDTALHCAARSCVFPLSSALMLLYEPERDTQCYTSWQTFGSACYYISSRRGSWDTAHQDCLEYQNWKWNILQRCFAPLWNHTCTRNPNRMRVYLDVIIKCIILTLISYSNTIIMLREQSVSLSHLLRVWISSGFPYRTPPLPRTPS